MKLGVPAVSVRNIGGTVYVTINEGGRCRFSRLRGGDVEDIISIRGSPCVLLWGRGDEFLVSAGNFLYLVFGNESRPVLRVGAGNWLWHAAELGGFVFVQEYGEPPTGIYATEDFRRFERVVTNIDVDPKSRHFHYVASDAERNLLVATLGDGNLVRAVVSRDFGRTWRPIYRGPWQFVPVLVERERWVFGFDSGIARGGVGIYHPEEGRWEFIFLKSPHRYAQFASLVRFGDLYVGGLGMPVGVVVSRDLKVWRALHIAEFSKAYKHFVDVAIWGDKVVASTGQRLLIFEAEELSGGKLFMKPYLAVLDRVHGWLFLLKKLFR